MRSSDLLHVLIVASTVSIGGIGRLPLACDLASRVQFYILYFRLKKILFVFHMLLVAEATFPAAAA